MKIESGLIKYEYTNKFNLRVNNYRRGGHKAGENYSSLDKFVQEQNQQYAQEVEARSIMKQELARQECHIKEEPDRDRKVIKHDPDGVKDEIGGASEPDCVIEKIDYSKKIPDFSKIPIAVIKNELTNNGHRTCTVNKRKTQELITFIWQYRKHGELPYKYVFEEEDEEPAVGIPQPVH